MSCIPCQKNKVFSQQFNNQGGIVERKTSEKIASAFNAGLDFLMQKTDKADNKTYKQRLSRCSHCDYLKRRQNLPKGADLSIKDSCLICGCLLKVKASQIGEEYDCPILWWEFENEDEFKAAFNEYQANKTEENYHKILDFISEKEPSRDELTEFCEKQNIDNNRIGFYLSEMINKKIIRFSFNYEKQLSIFIALKD